MKRIFLVLLFCTLTFAVMPRQALAADGATIIFRSGIRAYVSNGYSKILEVMKNLNNSSARHSVVQLDIEGAPFLLNVAEVVILCRDECTSLDVIDTRDPARSRANRGASKK